MRPCAFALLDFETFPDSQTKGVVAVAREPFRLRLMETFRTVFYTPIYVTVAGGYLETEGWM